jgi:hypothetical protein
MRKGFLNYLVLGLILAALLAVGGCAEAEVTTPPPEPADFEVISLDITPPAVMVGETVTVSVVVANIGGSDDTYTAGLAVDGVTIETKAIAIAAGTSQTITFSLVEDDVGTYEIEVGDLSGSMIVGSETTITPDLGVVADSEGVILDQGPTLDFGFVDIISVKVTAEGEEVTAQIELAELPETLMFNQAPEGRLEYEWVIYFDTDGNPETGTAVAEEVGADYALGISHWSSGEAIEDSILNVCRIDYWVSEGGSMKSQSGATAEVNYETNTLTLMGTIPGFNTDSHWFAVARYRDAASERSFIDQAPDIGFAQLPEETGNGEDS